MKKTIFTILIVFIFQFLPIARGEVNKSTVNVAFTIDNNYPVMTIITMESILDHNWSKSDYTFYIVENNMTEKNKKMMKKYIDEKKQKIEFVHIDTTKLDKKSNLFSFSNRITSIAVARILLPELLPSDVHKVIYMDADTIVTKDLKKLYDINLGNKPAGIVLNHAQENGAEKLYKFKNGYYNSGVILFNLDTCRKIKSADTMLNFLKTNADKFTPDKNGSYKNKWKFPDQDLINVVWDGKIKPLSLNWNIQCTNGNCTLDPNTNRGIIHYIGPNKPWDYVEVYKYTSYNQIYYGFLRKPTLSKYRCFFVYRKFIENYKLLFSKKIQKYKNIKMLMLSAEDAPNIFSIYYMPIKEKF